MAKKSIITHRQHKCFICGSQRNIETHHVIYGWSYRKLSDKYGLTVPLCHSCHNEPPNGVHFNVEQDLKLKRLAQVAFNYHYPDLSFTEIFGRNFLEDEDFETADNYKNYKYRNIY